MLEPWTSHCYRGTCQFSNQNGVLTIRSDDAQGKGLWYAHFLDPITAGMAITVAGSHVGGQVIAQWFAGEEWLTSQPVEPPCDITVPDIDADRLRIACRLTGQGTAVFRDISAAGPTAAIPGLPIPPPDMTQKHYVTGWKWGRNIALMVQGDEMAPPNYVQTDDDFGLLEIPYEITGFQHGRQLDLTIGNMYADPDPYSELESNYEPVEEWSRVEEWEEEE